jgi:uncharacterized protein (DUF2164 family)
MTLELNPERRQRLVESLRGVYLQDFDEELSVFRAERILDFVLEAAGPQIYNQAVQDARGFMQRKLDDLDGEVYAPDRAI